MSLHNFLQLLNSRWHITLILHLPHHRHTPGQAMQGVPNLQPHALAILLPLMIPKPELFNPRLLEKLCPLSIMPALLRPPVLKTIQFDRELCQRPIGVQVKPVHRILTSELESGEPPRSLVAP